MDKERESTPPNAAAVPLSQPALLNLTRRSAMLCRADDDLDDGADDVDVTDVVDVADMTDAGSEVVLGMGQGSRHLRPRNKDPRSTLPLLARYS